MHYETDPTTVPLCAETGYWEPLKGGERSSHSFCCFLATLRGTELCSLCSLSRDLSAMKLSSGCLLRLGEKEQLELTSCFGKERSNLDLCEPTAPLAAVSGKRCLHHKKEQPHRDWQGRPH